MNGCRGKDFELRDLTAADVDAAVALAIAQGWRDRRRFYEFVLRTPTCQPLAGVVDGRVIATGLATANGPVGWLGAIVVAAGFAAAASAGPSPRSCAGGFGRPVARRFRSRPPRTAGRCTSGWVSGSSPTTTSSRPTICPTRRPARWGPRSKARTGRSAGRLRARSAGDGRRSIGAAGRAGRERGRSGPAAGSSSGTARSAASSCRPSGPTARSWRRGSRTGFPAGPAPPHRPRRAHVRAGIPDEHEAAWRELQARGWQETWQAPRMLLGPDVAWRPDWIWGQINSAMG